MTEYNISNYDPERELIVVQTGPRGAKGDQGNQGNQGDSITIKGEWVQGTTYCPLDAVYADSSAAQGVQSLFIQKNAVPCAVSSINPADEPNRWVEIGAVDLSNVTGSIFSITQAGHGFTKIGTPVAYNGSAYVKASCASEDTAGFCVVREVIDVDSFLLQVSGQVPSVDPTVVDTGTIVPGTVYYVSDTPGELTAQAPTVPSYWVNPIAIGVSADQLVAVPWRPIRGPFGDRIELTYVAGDQQTVFDLSLPDAYGNSWTDEYQYQDLSDVDVYIDGEKKVRSGGSGTPQDYSYDYAGPTVTLSAGATQGSIIQVVVTATTVITRPGAVDVLPLADLDVDWDTGGHPAGMIDGSRVEFILHEDNAVDDYPVLSAMAPEQVMIYVDNVAQRPGVDFTVAGSTLTFSSPPQTDSVVWGTFLSPIPQALQTINHAVAINRDAADQHPTSAITGLDDYLGANDTNIGNLQSDVGDLADAVHSSTGDVTDIQLVTQAEYDVMSVPRPATVLYLIEEEV